MDIQFGFTVWSNGLRGLRITGMYLDVLKRRKVNGILDISINSYGDKVNPVLC